MKTCKSFLILAGMLLAGNQGAAMEFNESDVDEVARTLDELELERKTLREFDSAGPSTPRERLLRRDARRRASEPDACGHRRERSTGMSWNPFGFEEDEENNRQKELELSQQPTAHEIEEQEKQKETNLIAIFLKEIRKTVGKLGRTELSKEARIHFQKNLKPLLEKHLQKDKITLRYQNETNKNNMILLRKLLGWILEGHSLSPNKKKLLNVIFDNYLTPGREASQGIGSSVLACRWAEKKTPSSEARDQAAGFSAGSSE
ncbi:hypothetical protein KAT92_03155 [Candidatus Babeliales bacterium]|nr:hypothetical protein [Candidatus Babeliales bacterium]